MKTVIITGANGNLGSAVTQKFLQEGYRVVATVANETSIQSVHTHPNIEVFAVDLTNEEETTQFLNKVITKYQTVEAALLLVGGFDSGGIETTDGAELRKQYTLNFETTYYAARPLFNLMMEQNFGQLVFVGARPALVAEDGKTLLAYALSKSLVFKLAELLNETAKGKNVTATVVVPGVIDTPFNRRNTPDANFDDWVKPQQIAAVMEMICSDNGGALREPVLKVYGNS